MAFDITIAGIVQGVGFRPFVFRVAKKFGIFGYVKNNGGEVHIHAEGGQVALSQFIQYLKKHYPKNAVVLKAIVTESRDEGVCDFQIIRSNEEKKCFNAIPADLGICDECLADINNPGSRYYRHPFTSCTECGPRMTILNSLPFDRNNTSMNSFEMCPDCKSEYENPVNRRFHAQTICCPKCGPKLELWNFDGKIIPCDAIKHARELIKKGEILAVKGIGGFHLVCDAKNSETIKKLRKRKNRPCKPFAVMMKNIETVKEYCAVNEVEDSLLRSKEKPIVLLEQQELLNYEINPGLNTLGVMLPYSGIHQLLFDEKLDIIVATSGNANGLPLISDEQIAVKELKGIADYLLIHNRKITMSCDDSIVRVVDGSPMVIRRARGYAPIPIDTKVEQSVNILACGADLKNLFAINNGSFVYISQYNGDLNNMEMVNHYKNNINIYERILQITPEKVACDMHPDYISSRFAKETDKEVVYVQHHHAHAISALAENNFEGEAIGVIFDGTGYGPDGAIWGGEFLKVSANKYERLGHIKNLPLLGGDKCAVEPWRMAGMYLQDAFGDDFMNIRIPCCDEIKKNNWQMLFRATNSGKESPITSSAGRLFDAIGALMGLRYVNTYEGQSAIELEAVSDKNEFGEYPFEVINNKIKTIDFSKAIKETVKDMINGIPISVIGARFHNTVAKSIIDMCRILKDETGLNYIVVSGGVFQNKLLYERLKGHIISQEFILLRNNRIPTNDEGVSFGQILLGFPEKG